MKKHGTKVTLSSKKVVLLRDPLIKDQELAAQAIAGKHNDDKFVFVMMLNKEMVKLLIHSIDGKEVTPAQLEKLDEFLTVAEFGQLNQVVGKMTGNELESKGPLIETVSFGDK